MLGFYQPLWGHQKAISICHLKLRGSVGLMRRISPLTLVALMLLQTLAVGIAAPVSAAEARGGANDDFMVTQLWVGNSSNSAEVWTQSNGTTLEYLFEGDTIEIGMEVKRGGSSFSGKSTDAMIEVIHPIGYVMETFYWTSGDLIQLQSDSQTFLWTTSAAHSILNTTTNDLSGGILLRATVDKNSNGDDRNENDMMEQTVPIAIMNDRFDGSTTQSSTFFPARYPVNGGDASGAGSWQDLSGGAVGSKHWGNAAAGNNYPSNAHDRLVNSFLSPNGQNCGSEAQLDPGMSSVYGTWICRKVFYASNYVSSQIHIQAWGSVTSGDSVSIEMWRGSGSQNINESIVFDISTANPSQAPGQWTNLSWDPQVTYLQNPFLANRDVFLGGNAYAMGMVLRSDNSVASEGFHVDDWIQFGVRKVQEYTLDLSCDIPENGYSAPPSAVLSLSCVVTNNGYSPATIRADSNISNISWMNPANPMIRQDAVYINSAGYPTLINDHDTSILIPQIPGGGSIDLWVNLTIPPGSDVQQLTWILWLTDASGQNAGEKARVSAAVGVTEQFGVSLTSTVGLLAGSFGPGEYGLVPFRLQNTGNRDASFNLVSTFSEDNWNGLVVNETGAPVQIPISIDRGDVLNLQLNITAALQANPGTVSFNLRATCPSCGALFGTDVLVRNIEVPIFREVSLETDQTDFSGAANGITLKAYIMISNTGNDDEQYDLSLIQSNWQLGANLAASQTAIMDAWDGSSVIQLNLPMPIGLSPGLYSLTVTATSVEDPTVTASIPLTVDILDTAAVHVSDEDADQSYIPGGSLQTMSFEVRNDGNSADRFAMSFDLPVGMVVEFTNLFDGKTPEISTGTSYNVSVEFRFLDGTEGQLTLGVIATSVNDANMSATGIATYLVGSQNWLKIIPTEMLVIDDAEPVMGWSMTVTVRNQYTTAQSVSMRLVAGESSSWIQSRIASNDLMFSLDVEEEREVTVILTVSQTTLNQLGQDSFYTNLTLWAESQTVSDAASTTLQLQLIKPGSQSSDDGANSDSDGSNVGPILMWIGFISIFIVGVVVIFRILTEVEEEDDYGGWGAEGYEGSVEATYGAVAAAPTVPVAGAVYDAPKIVPNVPESMPPAPTASAPVAPTSLDGTPTFVQNITYNIQDSAISGELNNSIPAAVPTIPAYPAPAAPSPALGTADSAPPVPAVGLPEGWTMDQWNVYGQMWLEQNGQA